MTVENRGLVSIVMPTWNRAYCIKEVIQSVLSQTYPYFELIISDDGSTDDTVKIVQEFEDSRIRFLANSRGGNPAIARNRGLRQARGQWVAFLDSDDYWLPEKLAIQLELAQRYQVSFVCTNAYLDNSKQPYFKLGASRRIEFDELISENPVICSSVLLEKKVIEKVGEFNESTELRAFEDYEYWLRAAFSESLYYEEKPLLKYTTASSNSVRDDNFWKDRAKRNRLLVSIFERAFVAGKFGLGLSVVLRYILESSYWRIKKILSIVKCQIRRMK